MNYFIAAISPVNAMLFSAGRWPALSRAGQSLRMVEGLALLACGLAAGAASLFLEFQLRWPGHAIVRVALPLTLGLSLVPRRFSGSAMSMCGAGLIMVLGGGQSTGAFTSVLALGIALDLACSSVSHPVHSQSHSVAGWNLHWRFALAAIGVNLLAFSVRLGTALAGGGGQKILATWPLHLLSYVACGLLAGFIAAAICFRFRDGRS